MALLKKVSMSKYNTYSIGQYYLDPFQTTDGSQQTIASLPVKQNQYVSILSFEASGYVTDFSDTVEANLQAAFLRANGNIARTSSSNASGLIRNIFTSLGLLNTINLDAVANIGTQSIDFKVTGQGSKTINWNFLFTIKFSN